MIYKYIKYVIIFYYYYYLHNLFGHFSLFETAVVFFVVWATDLGGDICQVTLSAAGLAQLLF